MALTRLSCGGILSILVLALPWNVCADNGTAATPGPVAAASAITAPSTNAPSQIPPASAPPHQDDTGPKPSGLAFPVPADAAAAYAQSNDLSDSLAEAKKAGKPILLFLGNASSGSSKRIETENLADVAVKKALEPYLFVRIDISSPEAAMVRDNYGWRKGPLLAVLNAQGEAFDSLDLSSLDENLINAGLSSQLVEWLNTNADRFRANGATGYQQRALSANDPVRAAIGDFNKVKSDYSDASYVLLADEGKISVQPDGSSVAHYYMLSYINNDDAIHEATYPLSKLEENFHLVRARTITADFQENDVAPGDVSVKPLYRDYPSLDALRRVRFLFPGAKSGCFLEQEYEMTERPQMPGAYTTTWQIESNNIPSLHSKIEVDCPASLEPQMLVSNNSAPARTEKKGDRVVLTWQGHSEDYHQHDPDAAPHMSARGYLVVMSKTTWNDISRWFLGLADKGRAHSPEMDAWIDRYTSGVAPGPDQTRRTTDALLAGFYREFRYLSLQLSDGGYEPHPVAEVFQNKWGDCKDFALFLQECLKRKGIDSDLVLVDLWPADDVSQMAPRTLFQHAILRVHDGGKFFFVDPTTRLPAGVLASTETSLTGLVCTPDGAIPMVLPSMADVEGKGVMESTLSTLDAPTNHLSMDLSWSGNGKAMILQSERQMSRDGLKNELSRYLLGGKLSGASFTDFTINNDDASANPVTLHFEGTVHDLVNTAGNLLIVPTHLGTDRFYEALPQFIKTSPPSKERFVIAGYRYAPTSENISYQMGSGLEVMEGPKPVHVETPYFKVDRTVTQTGNTLLVSTAIAPKFVRSEAAYIPESSLNPSAQNLVEQLSQPVVFRVKPEEQARLASQNGDAGQLSTLLPKGADVESPDQDGMTLLMVAADNGAVSSVTDLLTRGAKINAVDKSGCTALLHACWTGRTEAALALINAGADVNIGSSSGQTPLMYAANKADVAVSRALVDHHANVNANSNVGPALTWAVSTQSGTPEERDNIAQALLAAGADPNLHGDHPITELMSSCGSALEEAVEYHPELVDSLLTHGADPNAPDTEGATPLMRAVTLPPKTAGLQ